MKARAKKVKIVKSLEEKWQDKQEKKLKHCTCGHATYRVDKKCKQHLNLHDFFQQYRSKKRKKRSKNANASNI
jgi:hypothetical protein